VTQGSRGRDGAARAARPMPRRLTPH